MPKFLYKAKSSPTEIVSGIIEAANPQEAVLKLSQSGQTPLEINAITGADGLDGQGNGQSSLTLPRGALPMFTRQLSDLLEAGVPLVRCMELTVSQRKYPGMVIVSKSIIVSLQQGASLSQSLEHFPGIFPVFYINTVKAAEASGHLPLVLGRLADFLEKDALLRSRVQSSLLYPAIVMGVGVLTIFIMLSFVLPKLSLMFDDFGAALPWPTQVVVGLSWFFGHFWWLLLVGGIALGASVRKYLSTEKGRLEVDQMLLQIPILKVFIENTQLSRFARTLGVLLESRVPVTMALESVAGVIDNMLLKREVKMIAIKVKEGVGLAQAIKSSEFFPPTAYDLISVGQESGKLESGLYKLADGCERSAQEMANVFVTILGPAVLVVVVGIVGFMITAMLLPMFELDAIIN